MLNERLLTIEWEQRELADVARSEAGSWLLLSTSVGAAGAAGLTDALTAEGASCTTVPWPLGADGLADAGSLRSHLGSGTLTQGLKGVVVVTGTRRHTLEPVAHRGRDYVAHLVGLARELAELPASRPGSTCSPATPRACGPDDLANLEQAGLRGLMRVIDSEHPHLSATQIDVDDENGRQAGGAATAQRVGGRRDRVAQRRLVHRAAAPRAVAPGRTARPPSSNTSTGRHAPADPHPR